MKKTFFLFGSALLILSACNNNKKPGEVTVKSDDGKTSTTIDANAITQSADAMQKKVTELQKLSPYTLDQMKALLPEELAGAKRSNFSANSAMGTSFAKGDYKLNDSTEIELNVFDCAGQAGAGVYNMQFLMTMNMQSESDNEYTKTIDFNGSKAVEHVEKNNNRSSLTWLAADRLLVTMEGRNTGIDVLKQAAGSLTFK